MRNHIQEPFDPENSEHQGELRDDAAGVIKEFILLRGRLDKDFLEKQRKTWWKDPQDTIPEIAARSPITILEDAMDLLSRFELIYPGFERSSSSPSSRGLDQFTQLRKQVIRFVNRDKLPVVREQLRANESVDWETFGDWDQLPVIRAALDRLPHPKGLKPDGPISPDGFRYDGEAYLGCTATPWLLISFLWNARNRNASWGDLALPVWRHAQASVDESNLGSAAREANRFFNLHRIPFAVTISRKTRTATLKRRDSADLLSD